MAKITISEALAQLPDNTAEVLNAIFKHNLSDDFLVDVENKKIHINFPTPETVLDIRATGATLDPQSFVLTVNRENGEPFNVDLAELAKIKIENPEAYSVTLEGDGTEANKLKADVKVSKEPDNQLQKKADGSLYVAPHQPHCLTLRDVFGQPLGEVGADIRVALCSATTSIADNRVSVGYRLTAGYGGTTFEVLNYPNESVNAQFTHIGGLSGNALTAPTYTVTAGNNGYVHQWVFSASSIDNDPTKEIMLTLEGVAVQKVLNHTSETADGEYIYTA